MDKLYLDHVSLQYENKALRKKVESFENGKRYKKLQEDYHRVASGYIREIQKLKREIADAHEETKHVLDIWYKESVEAWEEYQKQLAKKEAEIQKLTDEKWASLQKHDEEIRAMKKRHREELAEKEAIIDELKEKLAHATALLDRDGTNTSLPTSQTPAGKEKVVPNSRRSSGKEKGGQKGHKRHMLEKPAEEEKTEETDHKISDEAICPSCGGSNLVYTGEWEEKWEKDIQFKIVNRLHKYWIYKCADCGQLVRSGIDPGLRAECQYGPGVQAVSLSLMNTANAAINKVPMLLSGMTDGKIKPSEGYIAKLQKRAAGNLDSFRRDLYRKLVALPLLYWDDTVIRADKARICLRFYGDEKIAWYVAHEKKDMAGIIEDGVLGALTEEQKVMHDHNSINYNKLFVFINLECNAHLERDLQKSADETGHDVLLEIKGLISGTIKKRNDLIMAGKEAFAKEEIADFNRQMTDLLKKAKKEAEKNKSQYSGPTEKALVSRIINYRENYFAWVNDFSLPTTNNLSERALRGVKTKMKVSGQFASSKTADNYALIRTYVETCRRNGINEMEALTRLCEGNPYTVAEIFEKD